MTQATKDWFTPLNFQHWLKHIALPSLLIAAMLLMPSPWLTLKLVSNAEVIAIELKSKQQSKTIKTPQINAVNLPERSEQPPESSAKPETPVEQTNAALTITTKNIPKPNGTVITEDPPPAKVSVGEIFLSASNRTLIEIPTEFQAKSTDVNEFIRPEPVVTDWYANLPYLDESVDQPKLPMNFYAPGIGGSVDRFFDQASLMKTFTTKSGTTVDCTWIINLVLCGWQ